MTLRSKQQQMDWERIPEFKVLPKCRQLYFFFFFPGFPLIVHSRVAVARQIRLNAGWRTEKDS